jgi:hypothetical protein
METLYPQAVTPRNGVEPEAADHAENEAGVGNVLTWMREAYCGLHGHDNLLQFAHERMYLKCVSCGHESPGWELTETPPTVSARVETRRRPMPRPQLVSARRIA